MVHTAISALTARLTDECNGVFEVRRDVLCPVIVDRNAFVVESVLKLVLYVRRDVQYVGDATTLQRTAIRRVPLTSQEQMRPYLHRL